MSDLNNSFTLKALSSWVFRDNIHRYEAIPPLFLTSLEEETSFLCLLSGHYTLVEGEIGGMLESTFREFTITENTKNFWYPSLYCNTLGNLIHHYSEDNGSVFTTGPPKQFTSVVFQGSIKEELYFNKELVYTGEDTLNILTYDCCFEGSIDNLSIESTHHTIFRLSKGNKDEEDDVYQLNFERNLSWFQGDTITNQTEVAKYKKK